MDRTNPSSNNSLPARVLSCWAALWLSSVLSSVSLAEEAKRGATPSAAILFDQDLAVGTLLESGLLSEGGVNWLERERFDELIREQQLQAAQIAGNTSQRISLGKLLRADVLVLLRKVDKPSPHYRLVVCETERGLRLLTGAYAVGKDIEQDVTTLAGFVRQGINNYGEEVSDLYAVPPFVCEDLGYEHHHLQSVFTRLVEAALSDRQGLLRVELDEAKAIAQERAVIDRGTAIARRLPMYFLGSYRHVREGEEEKVRIRLSLRRGSKVVAEQELVTSRQDVTRQLRELVVHLAGESTEVSYPLRRSHVEAESLYSRAKDFRLRGDWGESANLCEASLLLEPERQDVRQLCIEMHSHQRNRLLLTQPVSVASGLAGLSAWSRMIEQTEEFLRRAGNLRQYEGAGKSSFISETRHFGYAAQTLGWWPEEVQRQYKVVMKQDYDTALRIFRQRAQAGYHDAIAWFYQAAKHVKKSDGTRRFDRKKQLELAYQLCEEIAELPIASLLARRLATGGYTIDWLDCEEGEAFIQRLAASSQPTLQRTADQLKRDIELGRQRPKRLPPEVIGAPEPLSPKQPLRVREVEVTLVRLDGRKVTPPRFSGAAKVGQNADVFWSQDWVGVMKRPGVISELWNARGKGVLIENVSFDGKYIWFSVVYTSEPVWPKVVVLDPNSRRSWEVNAGNGLPIQDPKKLGRPLAQRLMVRCYGAGKACVIGSFSRAWIATVEFDPLSGSEPSVQVIHEATRVADRDDPNHWRDSKLAFYPTCAYVIPSLSMPSNGTRTGESPAPASDESAGPSILVGRSATYTCNYYPLIVDPETGTVRVIGCKMPNPVGTYAPLGVVDVEKDSLYFNGFNIPESERDRPSHLSLYRMRSPDFKPWPRLEQSRPGRVLFYDGECYICGSEWWRVNFEQQKCEWLDRVPWYFEPKIKKPVHYVATPPRIKKVGPDTVRLGVLAVTNHYGITAISYQNGKAWRVLSMTVDEVLLSQQVTD